MSFTARLTHNLIVSIVMHHIYIALRPYFVSKLWFCHTCVDVKLKLIYILIHLNPCGLRWIRKYPYKLWEKCTSILVHHKLASNKLVTIARVKRGDADPAKKLSLLLVVALPPPRTPLLLPFCCVCQRLLGIFISMTIIFRHWRSQIHHNFSFMMNLWRKVVRHRSRVILELLWRI